VPHGFKAYVVRFLPRIPNPYFQHFSSVPQEVLFEFSGAGQYTTTMPGYTVHGTAFQLEGLQAASGREWAEGVRLYMDVTTHGISPMLVLQSVEVRLPVTFQLHLLVNERGAAEMAGVADAFGGLGADIHDELLYHQRGINSIQLGGEPTNFHVPALTPWQEREGNQSAPILGHPLVHSLRQMHTLATNGTIGISPGDGSDEIPTQYFCQGHSTLVVVVCADLTRGMVLEVPPRVRDGKEPIPTPSEWDSEVAWRLDLSSANIARFGISEHQNDRHTLDMAIERLMMRLFPDGLCSASVRVHERFVSAVS
jgi:hypothetical protein